ncbi:TlyA family RNA methyltransferase [Kallotenue papyrolyticum]|uniref:TlyA family RNA methyltransferase n=1 Tax=Kallotenue papyrolyticum TaxID=1325125 RepID=UPI00047866FE|nr:TlyA family RNA methyltransferase [Kallotenue papyrolyticum]
MKQRLDMLLVERELAPSRARAQALILAGQVYVDGQKRTKAGELVDVNAVVEVRGGLPFVGRGGLKLAHALDTFALEVRDRIAIDVGAATGGFTDVLLQRGAARVYAIDVGYGQLAYRLRHDPRVVLLERTNIRTLTALPAGVLADCGVVDVSFISLRLVLPAMQRLLRPDAWIVALIKPQFEAGPQDVGKGGVVRDTRVHRRVLREVLSFAAEQGLPPHGLTASPIRGPAGNFEFLAWLGGPGPELALEPAIELALAETAERPDASPERHGP